MSTDLEATLDARGYYVALDVPSGATFGMDTATWTTGDEFAGVKAVPVGVHLVTIRAPPSSTRDERRHASSRKTFDHAAGLTSRSEAGAPHVAAPRSAYEWCDA